ncbi:MAG: hypothetical protein QM784_31115 [Polyangiaceae bacterium]
MSLIFGNTHEGDCPASAELLLVAAPGRLSRFSELPRPRAEHNHVIVRDSEESAKQFWLRALRRARSIVARGKCIRKLSYVVAAPEEDGSLPERIARAFASTLSPGSTIVLMAPGVCRKEVFRTMERLQPSLREITVKAMFDDSDRDELITPEEPSRVRLPSLARTASPECPADSESAVA